ncbi:YkvA family protein [Dermatophilaceae bacterium Sec6.4]|nr:YkvA family protein [Actinomycetota bacterium]
MSLRSRGGGNLAAVRSLRESVALVSAPGGPSFSRRIGAVPRMVRAIAAKEYVGSSPARLAVMVAATAYIASPIDLIPRRLAPIAGLADDAVVLAWLASAIVQDTDEFLQWEATRSRRRTVRGKRIR